MSEANSLEIINTAAAYIAEHSKPEPSGHCARRVRPTAGDQRRAKAAALAPTLRSIASFDKPMVGHFTDDERVLEFLSGSGHPRLAELGTSCPDHFLRTKVKPLVLDLHCGRPGRGLHRPASVSSTRRTAPTTRPTTNATRHRTHRRFGVPTH